MAERTERERIASLEDKTELHSSQIKNLQSHIGVTEKLTVMYEQQQALSEKVQEANQQQFQYFKEQLEKQHDRDERFLISLNEISASMHSLDDNLKETKNDVTNVTDKVNKMEKEKQLKDEAVENFKKNLLYKIVFPVVTGVLVTALIIWLGLK